MRWPQWSLPSRMSFKHCYVQGLFYSTELVCTTTRGQMNEGCTLWRVCHFEQVLPQIEWTLEIFFFFFFWPSLSANLSQWVCTLGVFCNMGIKASNYSFAVKKLIWTDWTRKMFIYILLVVGWHPTWVPVPRAAAHDGVSTGIYNWFRAPTASTALCARWVRPIWSSQQLLASSATHCSALGFPILGTAIVLWHSHAVWIFPDGPVGI